ncbi:hypothetical protein A3D73_01890 [Candidatus Uhrbacteria bacterium RIFCSPHIGHO2_02_FULL_60_44]|nr:MAG: hypothetical protein A3D73_01890 [Candidatus Uhrbacteria bacterium RIFCSPHIGHO2_02_FULL_60_44]
MTQLGVRGPQTWFSHTGSMPHSFFALAKQTLSLPQDSSAFSEQFLSLAQIFSAWAEQSFELMTYGDTQSAFLVQTG